MIIRKKFKFEGAHIVRNCTTDRCKKSLHGHSYVVELFLKSSTLDNGGMVMDFSLTKGAIKDLIDSFDHTYVMWNKEPSDFKYFIKQYSERWIEMPVSPSAENLAKVIHWWVRNILKNTEFSNGEGNVIVKSVRVHETETGYAETEFQDVGYLPWDFEDFKFSPAIIEDWSNCLMVQELENKDMWVNPEVKQQIL